MREPRYSLKTDIPHAIRIAICSDLHDNPFDRAVSILRHASPDLIALPGDLGENPYRSENYLAFMSACAEIAPTVYALGNHDKAFHDDPVVADAIRATGTVLLDDTDIELCGIWVGGLTTGFRNHKREGYFAPPPSPNLKWLDDTFCQRPGFKLLLCHHPEYYPTYLKERDVSLVLSGHAHGGQWQFFGRGVLAPGQGLFPRYTYGVHDNRLVISRGMGDHTWIPRLFNPREVVIVDLSPDDQAK